VLERQQVFASGYGRFLRSWFDSPSAVGALAPSSRLLARRMTRDIFPGARVIELGPGTGTVTREIRARGVEDDDLVLLERCPGFADLLERDFPTLSVIRGDATQPQPALAPRRGAVDFVISGLPLVLFSRHQKGRLLEQSFELLDDDGAFYQFTYGGRCPVDRRDLHRLGLVARCVGFVIRNVPPAFIYRIARPRALRAC
jgi:phosphatidylethanolamine/phosphatidyl-N-methylethanolamine N-methyltransferase